MFLKFLAPACLIALVPASGAETVFSDAVGYVKLGNTEGGETPAVPANTDVYLSIPLEAELQFSGSLASWNVNAENSDHLDITFAGAPNWTSDTWISSEPHSVIVTSGAESGLRGVIMTNGSDTVTFEQITPGDMSNVSVGDSLEIRKCWTVSTFFANADLHDLCEVKTYFRNLQGINHSTSTSYTYFDGVWYDSFGPADGAILYPGELIVFRSAGSAIQDLAVFGDVATFNQRNEIVKDIQGQNAEDLHLGASLPIPKQIGDLNIPAANLDTISFYDNIASGTKKSVTQILTYFDADWYDSFGIANDFIVEPGAGFVYRRHQDSPGTSAEWSEPAP